MCSHLEDLKWIVKYSIQLFPDSVRVIRIQSVGNPSLEWGVKYNKVPLRFIKYKEYRFSTGMTSVGISILIFTAVGWEHYYTLTLMMYW